MLVTCNLLKRRDSQKAKNKYNWQAEGGFEQHPFCYSAVGMTLSPPGSSRLEGSPLAPRGLDPTEGINRYIFFSSSENTASEGQPPTCSYIPKLIDYNSLNLQSIFNRSTHQSSF